MATLSFLPWILWNELSVGASPPMLQAMCFNHLPFTVARLAVLAAACWFCPLRGGTDVAIAGPVTVVRADPHHQGTLLAGTATALLYRSRDGAASWTKLSFPAELRSTLHALMIDPARANVYLAAVTSEEPQYAGLFRSVDEGATWEQLHDLRHKQVWSLAALSADGNVIAAGTEEGVFLTHDSGDNWTHISSTRFVGPRPVVALAFDPAHRNVLYAGTPHLPWKTTDGGATWRVIRKGMPDDSDIFSIDVDGARPRRLFAGACSGIYRSLDGGNTWASLEQAVGAQFRTYVVAHAPRSPDALFVGTSAGLLQSLDGGVTWRQLSPRAARSIAFDPADSRRVFIATDQGVLRSQDGGAHFMAANQGLYVPSTTVAFERNDDVSRESSAGIRTKQ
jgi:photosystem II stability/assembly factor-like uncharacterized protein